MPVSNRIFAQAELKILTGVIAPHHLAGFGGGWEECNSRNQWHVVSDNLTRGELEEIFLKKSNSIEDAVGTIEKKTGGNGDMVFIPYASEIIPSFI